jgi:hypothetical protein
MPRKKKEPGDKKKFTEPIQRILPDDLPDYNQPIRAIYDEMKVGDKVEIAPNVQLVKLPFMMKGFRSMIALDVIARHEIDEQITIPYPYRYPLNFITLKQFNAVSNVMGTKSLEKMVVTIDRINLDVKKFNDELYQKQQEIKKEKQRKKLALEGEIDSGTETEEN